MLRPQRSLLPEGRGEAGETTHSAEPLAGDCAANNPDWLGSRRCADGRCGRWSRVGACGYRRPTIRTRARSVRRNVRVSVQWPASIRCWPKSGVAIGRNCRGHRERPGQACRAGDAPHAHGAGRSRDGFEGAPGLNRSTGCRSHGLPPTACHCRASILSCAAWLRAAATRTGFLPTRAVLRSGNWQKRHPTAYAPQLLGP